MSLLMMYRPTGDFVPPPPVFRKNRFWEKDELYYYGVTPRPRPQFQRPFARRR